MKLKQRSNVGRRAWSLFRLALLWARKGGVFKNRLIMDLRHFPKYLKSQMGGSNGSGGGGSGGGALHYGDRELSFDETPIIHIKMHPPNSLRFKMPNIPCIKPSGDFDYDFDYRDDGDDEETYAYGVARKSLLKDAYNNDDDDYGNDGDHDVDDDEDYDDDGDAVRSCDVCEDVNDCYCDDEIDMKAEKFIANFYEQMKMQKQIAYLEYNDGMLNRGVN